MCQWVQKSACVLDKDVWAVLHRSTDIRGRFYAEVWHYDLALAAQSISRHAIDTALTDEVALMHAH